MRVSLAESVDGLQQEITSRDSRVGCRVQNLSEVGHLFDIVRVLMRRILGILARLRSLSFVTVLKVVLRKLQLLSDELTITFSSPRRRGLRLFSLDLHIGVIADLAVPLSAGGAAITRWSISRHNFLQRRFLGVPDPVGIVNARTWKQVGSKRIANRFRGRYQNFLRHFDGFVVTHTPAFAELYSPIGKPILVVVSTRYEAPFTSDPTRWQSFDEWLIKAVKDGQVTIASNNRGDADYLHYFTGLDIDVVPSLCKKPGGMWTGGSGRHLILGRVPALAAEVVSQTQGMFQPVSILGEPYAWVDLLRCEEILVLPQNISTMTLFELATAGIPVAVPSKAWMIELRGLYPDLLAELSYAQLRSISPEDMDEAAPHNWKAGGFLTWWLDRADFYDGQLMPNVRTVGSFAELQSHRTDLLDLDHYLARVKERNRAVEEKSRNLAEGFMATVRGEASRRS